MQLHRLRWDISYTRMDFIPYIHARGWENSERVFKSDRAYWVKLLSQFKEDGAAMGELFFEYLWSFDISDWNSRPVETALWLENEFIAILNSIPDWDCSW